MNIQRGTKGRREAPALFECWQQSKQTKSKEAQKEGLQPPPSLNFCAWGTRPRRLPRQGEITPHKPLGPEHKNTRFRIQILYNVKIQRGTKGGPSALVLFEFLRLRVLVPHARANTRARARAQARARARFLRARATAPRSHPTQQPRKIFAYVIKIYPRYLFKI